MIEIKKEIIEQIRRSVEKDPDYFSKILRRLDFRIKDAIYVLLESGLKGSGMFVAFYKALENGLENFNMPEKFDGNVHFKEIKEHNPEIAEFMEKCVYSGRNQFWVLVILYRIFESELEVRCMT